MRDAIDKYRCDTGRYPPDSIEALVNAGGCALCQSTRYPNGLTPGNW